MILTEQNLKPEALLRFFKKNFPEIDWVFIDLYSDDDDVQSLRKKSIDFYLVQTHDKQYPLEIAFVEDDEDLVDAYELKVAKALSDTFQMKTVIDFIHPDTPDEPFYSLLFDKQKCFLVDNSEWETQGIFHIVEPWEYES